MNIIKWDELSYQIEHAQDWEEIKKMSDKMAAFKVWAQQTKQSLDTQTKIAEYRLRLERKKGQWLSDADLDRGALRQGQSSAVSLNNHGENSIKLSDLNITKNESYNAQQIASIPDETFEEFIESGKAKVNNAVAELTTTGAVKLAKSLKEKKKDLDDHLEDQEQLDAEKELKKIAHDINMTYTKEQRRFFINLIKI